MRLTQNKLDILAALSETDPDTMLEWGPPPRNAATIAKMIDKDMRTVARTLRNMAEQGLVTRETRMTDVWSELKYKSAHFEKDLTCYWNASGFEKDKAAADEWTAGATARAEKAWKKYDAFMTGRSTGD